MLPSKLHHVRNAGASALVERETAGAHKVRWLKAKADITEMEAGRIAGNLLPAQEVEREWSGVLHNVRARLLAVPSRVRQRLPHLTAADIRTLDEEIRAALTELSDDAEAGTARVAGAGLATLTHAEHIIQDPVAD